MNDKNEINVNETPLNLNLTETPTSEEQTNELEVEEKVMEGVEEEFQNALDEENSTPSFDELNKKNYIKISPTFYIRYVEPEEPTPEGEEEKEIYKILNPKSGVVETRELTDEEKREILIKEIKQSKTKFNPIKYGVKTVGIIEIPRKFRGVRKEKDKVVQTNVTVNQFGAAYRKARKHKNRAQKASRKANR